MLNAFLAILIVFAILAFGYGFVESWAGSMSDAPVEGDLAQNAGLWTCGVAWVALWALISLACAVNGHSYAAIIVGVTSAVFTALIVAFLYVNAYQMSHH